MSNLRHVAFLYLVGVTGSVLSMYLGVFIFLKQYGLDSDLLTWSLGYAAHGGAKHVLASQFWAHSMGQIVYGIWSGWASALMWTDGNFRSIFFQSTVAIVVFLTVVGAFIRNEKNDGHLREVIR